MHFRLFDGVTKAQREELVEAVDEQAREVERTMPERHAWHAVSAPSWWDGEDEASATTLATLRGPHPRPS